MYKKNKKGWLKHWDFVLLDMICLQTAFIIAYHIRHGSGSPYTNRLYLNMAFVLMLIQIFAVFFLDSFKNVLKRGFYREFADTVKHSCTVILIATFYVFVVQQGGEYSRLTLIFTGLIYIGIGYLGRNLLKHYLLTRDPGAREKSSLLIITAKANAEQLLENIHTPGFGGYHLVGFCFIDGDGSETMVGEFPVVTEFAHVLEYACREWVDEVFVCIPREKSLPWELMDDFIEMGVTVHLELAEISNISGPRQSVEKVGPYTVWTGSVSMASWKDAFYKRTLDILGGLVGCLITAVLCVVVAPAIYIQSPGPIFFAQERVGKGGRRFRMYKFRSMYLDAEERKKELMEQNRVKDGMMFKLDHDPRIIGGDKGIGGFIRRYSIDEFPQFFNVLKGDMSLVGTRPPTLDEWERYELHHRVRLAIKPGVTGMWQVSGRSEITDFEEVVRLDKGYIMNWSVGLDLKILCKTVLVVLGKKGSM